MGIACEVNTQATCAYVHHSRDDGNDGWCVSLCWRVNVPFVPAIIGIFAYSFCSVKIIIILSIFKTSKEVSNYIVLFTKQEDIL